MAENLERDRRELLQKLVDHIRVKFPPKKAELIIQFVKRCFNSIAYEDLRTRSLDNLLGSFLSFWGFFQERRPSEKKIRVYNPEFERDGWQSTYTIIEIAHDNIPFLVDSMRAVLNDANLLVRLMMYTGGLEVIRDRHHKLMDILPPRSQTNTGLTQKDEMRGKSERKTGVYLNVNEDFERAFNKADRFSRKSSNKEKMVSEAPIYIEIDRLTDANQLTQLKLSLELALRDTALAVSDWPQMKENLQESIVWLNEGTSTLVTQELAESQAFLSWLLEDNFIFLGCRDYDIINKRGNKALSPASGSSLGILQDTNVYRLPYYFSDLPQKVIQLAFSSQVLMFTKTDIKSRVHTNDYLDCIIIKRFNRRGNLMSERHFVGLFTLEAYHCDPSRIPILRRKVERVLKESGLPAHGYGWRTLKNILEDLPREDLFQSSVHELLKLSTDILHLQERQRVRLFIRKDISGRFFSCLVFIPRDRFNTELRQKIWRILKESLNGKSITFVTTFSKSPLARIYFTVRIDPNESHEYDVNEIEQKLVEAGRSWYDEFKELLIDYYGESKGLYYADRYRRAFPASYREQFDARTAVHDIAHIENLSAEHLLSLSFYQPANEKDNILHFKLFRHRHNIPLSDVLPMFENLGLRIIDECPHKITLFDGTCAWINDFEITYMGSETIDIYAMRDILQAAFTAVWYGYVENDKFNKLVLTAKLSWREVALLRAYSRYFRQIGFTFSQNYIEETLIANPSIAKYLVDLFNARFDPKGKHIESLLEIIENKITQALDHVSSLDQDRILRRYLNIILATLRTNYFQKDAAGELKNYFSFKLDPTKILEMPKPFPKYEIFVYSPRFEGVHLRAAKVARGGLRWSDRREDFRTEVLGLMKAQQVKNAVIIPQGAKGGFVAKYLPANGSRDEILEEGIYCYRHFIKGLLDITDNLVNQEIIVPQDVIRYDDNDHYLVVAADKGTATFSDIANKIAEEYRFWLGDAFASGGSTGYDHKRMGITARGVWESVKRHFREIQLDVQSTDFTVVGVGDMSGDVFGNGILLSKHIRLVAAFNHMHIFIDPNPNAEVGYAERQRLFSLPRSTWADYNPDLISPGGGIFRRSTKFIKLTPEIQKVLNISKEFVIPADLIRAILQAKVDLLYNGGIGTYVKASYESNQEVGDRGNDAVRIDAKALQCRVIAEGGNLGLTQLARIEYELNGGRVYTDFIDNSAGVDCSDHEVNIKILLNHVVAHGEMTMKQRNHLLAEMTDQVAELVLKNNYRQTQAISLAELNVAHQIELYSNYLDSLEDHELIDRELEFLPETSRLLERKSTDKGLTRPELSVLMAYTKNILKHEIINSDLPEDVYLSKMLLHEFPKPLRIKYYSHMKSHSLSREIIATQLSNDVVDRMGLTFVYRLRDETGASIANVIRAYAIVKRIFTQDILWQEIEHLDYRIDAMTQLNMMRKMNRLIRRATRWFLRHRSSNLDIDLTIKQFEKSVDNLIKKLPMFLVKEDKEKLMQEIDEFIQQGVPERLAKYISYCPILLPALDIVQAALDSGFSIREVAIAYFIIGGLLDINWFRKQLSEYDVDSRWDALARVTYRDDLDRQQRILTIAALKSQENRTSIRECVERWAEQNQPLIARWNAILVNLKSTKTIEPTMFSVGLSGLDDLCQNCVSVQVN